MPPETFPIALLALLLDALFGYPDWVFQKIGHPVSWIGAFISFMDRRLNKQEGPLNRKLAGIIAIVCVTAAASATGISIQMAVGPLPFGSALIAIAAATLFASRSLYTHVRDVASALDEGGLEAGRGAVSRIAGRDPETLDRGGIARAAIESLAENASDGVVAPVFWFLALGLPGLAAYKAINTADSMIGRRTPQYAAFGWASAKLDDLVNLPASRLTAGLFVLAAVFCEASPGKALEAVWRDAGKHRSPNAGWPESAMAGALGLRLAGPRSYGGIAVPDAYMGDGRQDASAKDVGRALGLARIAWLIMLGAIGFLALLTAQA